MSRVTRNQMVHFTKSAIGAKARGLIEMKSEVELFVEDFMKRHHLKNQPAFGAFHTGKGRKLKAQFTPFIELVSAEWEDYLKTERRFKQ